MVRATQELETTDPTRSPMARLLARFEDHTLFCCHLLAELLRRDRLGRTVGTNLAWLRLRRITHVEIQKLLPLRKIVASHRVRMLRIKILVHAMRDDRLRFEGPRAGEFFRPRTLDLFVTSLKAHHEQAVATLNFCRLIGSIRVHDDKRLVES